MEEQFEFTLIFSQKVIVSLPPLSIPAAATTVVNLPIMCFIHSEGDPLGGWSTGAEWRADVRYAAMVVKVRINS